MKNRNLNDFDDIFKMYSREVYRLVYSRIQGRIK